MRMASFLSLFRGSGKRFEVASGYREKSFGFRKPKFQLLPKRFFSPDNSDVSVKINWRAGIKTDGQLTINVLRKCCIKTWADYLPPNVTQNLAGHSNLKTTLKSYTLVDDYHRKKAADVMDQWLKVTPRGIIKAHMMAGGVQVLISKSLINYPRCDSNAQPLAPEANALSN